MAAAPDRPQQSMASLLLLARNRVKAGKSQEEVVAELTGLGLTEDQAHKTAAAARGMVAGPTRLPEVVPPAPMGIPPRPSPDDQALTERPAPENQGITEQPGPDRQGISELSRPAELDLPRPPVRRLLANPPARDWEEEVKVGLLWLGIPVGLALVLLYLSEGRGSILFWGAACHGLYRLGRGIVWYWRG